MFQLFVYMSAIKSSSSFNQSFHRKKESPTRFHVNSVKNVASCGQEGLNPCYPNRFRIYRVKEFYISENNTFNCNEEFIEILFEQINPDTETNETVTRYLSGEFGAFCLFESQRYSETCKQIKK